MTREEKIICKAYLNDLDITHDCNEYKLLMELLDREPCEDCVSRQQAIEFVNEAIGGKNELADAIRDGVEAVLSAMPPVTPVACIAKVKFSKEDMQELVDKKMKDIVAERKKSKWIKRESATGLELYYECSNCGNHCLYQYVEIGFQNAKTKFCPNCGAEMEGEE